MTMDFSGIIPPVGAYPCRGDCKTILERPGVCEPCGNAIDAREHDATLKPALDSIPERFRWATLETIAEPECDKPAPGCCIGHRVRLPRVHRASAGNLLASRVIVLIGPPGAGKSSLACALLRAVIDSGRSGMPNAGAARARRARFFAARHLAPSETRDRREGPAPAALVARASVIVIDDVGQESGGSFRGEDRSSLVRDILAERHDEGSQTIVTTYADRETWCRLYGDGAARRYLDAADGVRVVRVGMTAKGAV